MRARQPKIDAPFGPFEFALLALGTAAAGLSVVATAAYWPGLPEKIPTHFNFAGKADGWGPKWTLLFLPALGIFMVALMAALSRFPHIYNYPWRITEENAPAQYRCARRLILALGAEIPWLFLYILWGSVRVAREEAQGLDAAFLLLWLMLMAVTMAVYFVNAARAR